MCAGEGTGEFKGMGNVVEVIMLSGWGVGVG